MDQNLGGSISEKDKTQMRVTDKPELKVKRTVANVVVIVF